MGHTLWQFLTEHWLSSILVLLLIVAAGIVIFTATGMTRWGRILSFLGVASIILALWLVPIRQAAQPGLDIMERITAENAARQTLTQIIGGAVLLVGLYFTWANLKATQKNITNTQNTATKNLKLAREGQVTDRFTKAIDQLAGEKMAVRLGGIYALERIGKDSPRDHWTIMEVLTAYIRDRSPLSLRDPKPLKDGPACIEELPSLTEFRLEADIQAVLTVLGRQTPTYENGVARRFNLTNADLRTADLRNAQLQHANLYKAHLKGVYLQDANLEDAYLRGADLRRACLHRAKLQGAHLRDAQLQDADLLDAQLQGAGLQDAKLQGANLKGASLQGACLAKATLPGKEGVTVEQLLTAKTLYGATGAIFDDPSVLQQIERRRPSLRDEPPRHNPNDPDDLCAESSQP